MNATSQQTMNPPHSSGKPGASFPATNISVRFVVDEPRNFRINHAMKASASTASHNEGFAFATTAKSAPPADGTPFADLILHPEKLEAAFKAAKNANDAFEASRTFGSNAINRIARTASPAGNGARRSSSHASPNFKIKPAEFYLEAPSAKSVKLAADFTEWEKFPIDLVKSGDG